MRRASLLHWAALLAEAKELECDLTTAGEAAAKTAKGHHGSGGRRGILRASTAPEGEFEFQPNRNGLLHSVPWSVHDITTFLPCIDNALIAAQLMSDAMEPDELEHDSTFGGDRASIASSSTSLLSSVTKYEYENGRRYHAYQAGKYAFPNDEVELERMDIEHHNQMLQLDGALHLAPLETPREILDLGTGTGIWAMDMGDKYPSAQVIGTDLSPVQPEWTAPNVQFVVDDFEQEW